MNRIIPALCAIIIASFSASIRADDDHKAKSTMRDLYHDLELKNERAKNEYKVSLELSDMEAAYEECIGKDASLDSCRRLVSVLKDKIFSRTHDAQILAEQKKQTELLKAQREEASRETNTSVTIVEDNPYQWRHRYDRWHPNPSYPPYRAGPTAAPRYTPRPGFIPQNRFQAGEDF